jgi:CheY-like chemotaxis protein
MATLLIVDDDAALAEGLCEVLEEEGFACWPAADANEALRRLHCESNPPDFILADLRMPGMAAFELLRIVRTTPGWSQVAFVLMTAGIEDDVPLGIPVDGLLLKPFGIEQLLHALRSALQHRRSEDTAASA